MDEIAEALDAGEDVRLLLIRRECEAPGVAALRARAEAAGIDVILGSDNDLWRMRRVDHDVDVLGLVGRNPDASLDEVLPLDGVIWLMVGVRYPTNVGYVIRTAEVSGADAVVIDAGFDRAERIQARRVAMGAHRFLPVFWELSSDVIEVIDGARAAGRRVVAIETSGDRAPWDEDLTRPLVLVLGGERDGIPAPIVERCDAVVRIPMAGFVPSYNLQAAMAAVASERLRQLSSSDA